MQALGFISDNIERLKGLIDKDPQRPLYHALLGACYFENKDFSNAKRESTKAIELDPTNSETSRAYLTRALVHKLEKSFDLALKDLNQAKLFFGEISDSLKEKIISEHDLTIQALFNRAAEKEESPALVLFRAGMSVSRTDFLPPTEFFNQLKCYIEDKCDSAPIAKENDLSQSYWRAFALCRKAVISEAEQGPGSQIANLYVEAKSLFKRIIEVSRRDNKIIPSEIYFCLATTLYRLEEFNEARQYLAIAIEKNSAHKEFYMLKALLENDHEQIALLIQQDSLQRAKERYSQVSHLIEFYDQIKLDQNTFYDLFTQLVLQQKLSLTERELKVMEADKVRAILQDFGIVLDKDLVTSIYSPLPSNLYGSLRRLLDIELTPKRGETLDPIEILYAERAHLGMTLIKGDPGKYDRVILDSQRVLESVGSQNPLFKEMLLKRSAFYLLMNQPHKAIGDLRSMAEFFPEDKDSINRIRELEATMED